METFQEPGGSGKVWVKAGTFDAGTRSKFVEPINESLINLIDNFRGRSQRKRKTL